MNLRHEIKIFEQRLKVRISEMSHQKSAISATFEEGRVKQESHQSELELQGLALQRLERQLADKDEELDSAADRAKAKLSKVK